MATLVLVVCCRRSLVFRLCGASATANPSALINTIRRASTASFESLTSSHRATLPERNRGSSTTSECSTSRTERVNETEKWSAALPGIPYGFPEGDTAVFAAERSGGLQKQWLQTLQREVSGTQAAALRVQHYLPNKEDLWRSPPYEALHEIVLRSPYHDALKIIMEHDYRFLFSDVMCSAEAPMPHVIYEDFMKCLTFCSRQRPPEEQFALPEPVLRDILSWAGYYCTLDRFYFTSASILFRKIEQEQHMSPALHSAWIYVCTAAGKLDEALAYASYMEAHNIPFDADVFAYMLHPSLTPPQQRLQQAPQTSRGIVLQRRLCQDMNQHHGTLSVAVHAMFVYHILTLQHTGKWVVLHKAAELFNRRQRPGNIRGGVESPALLTPASVPTTESPREVICSRTMQLAMSLFCREKGVRCGPRTTKELITFMLESEEAGCTAADVIYVLLRTRRNESTAVLAALPRTAFSDEEQEALMRAVHHRSRRDPAYAVAEGLLEDLLSVGDSTRTPTNEQRQIGSDEAIDRSMLHLRELAELATNRDATHLISDPKSRAAAVRAPGEDIQEGSAPPTLSSADASGDQSEITSPSWPMMDSQVEDVTPSPPEIARDLLVAVAALDRESVAAAQTGKQMHTYTQTRLPESSNNPSLTAAEEDRLHELYVSLEAIEAPSSLSAWSLQQLKKEKEEERLQLHAPNAWISPTYAP